MNQTRSRAPRHALATAAAGLLLLNLLPGCMIHVNQDQDEVYTDKNFSMIVVDSDAGDVTVRLGDEARVGRTFEWAGEERPVSDVWVSDEVLHATVNCGQRGWWPGQVCNVALDITVPDGVQVDVWTAAGDVEISDQRTTRVESEAGEILLRNIAGNVQVETDAGDVTVQQVEGTVSLRTDAGDVWMEGLLDSAEAWSDAGDIEVRDARGAELFVSTSAGAIDIEQKCSFDNIEALSDAGDIKITVPSGAYDLNLKTEAGEIRTNKVDDQQGAESTIRARTSAGDIRIVGR